MTNSTAPADFHCGVVALMGAPNAGKSTLLNRLLGEKIAITSRKPQTTRNRILGVVHRPAAQLILLDTPGVHTARGALNQRIVATALAALEEADLALLVADVAAADPASEALLVERLATWQRPVVVALNKIDRLPAADIAAPLAAWQAALPAADVVPISARHGTGLDTLLELLEQRLPAGPALFPEDSLTDLPTRFIVAELIREKVFRLTGQEVPYASAVTVESFSEEPGKRLTTIAATIHVERDTQKGILIGRGGSKLKEIGQAARLDIERLLGGRLMLHLFVRVEKNWSRDARRLTRFGYA